MQQSLQDILNGHKIEKRGRPKLPSDERLKREKERKSKWYVLNKKSKRDESRLRDYINDYLYFIKYLGKDITIDEYIKMKEQFIHTVTYNDYKKLMDNIRLLPS